MNIINNIAKRTKKISILDDEINHLEEEKSTLYNECESLIKNSVLCMCSENNGTIKFNYVFFNSSDEVYSAHIKIDYMIEEGVDKVSLGFTTHGLTLSNLLSKFSNKPNHLIFSNKRPFAIGDLNEVSLTDFFIDCKKIFIGNFEKIIEENKLPKNVPEEFWSNILIEFSKKHDSLVDFFKCENIALRTKDRAKFFFTEKQITSLNNYLKEKENIYLVNKLNLELISKPKVSNKTKI